jgi:hypothetical protein
MGTEQDNRALAPGQLVLIHPLDTIEDEPLRRHLLTGHTARITVSGGGEGERDLRPWPHPGRRDALRSAAPPSRLAPRSPPGRRDGEKRRSW